MARAVSARTNFRVEHGGSKLPTPRMNERVCVSSCVRERVHARQKPLALAPEGANTLTLSYMTHALQLCSQCCTKFSACRLNSKLKAGTIDMAELCTALPAVLPTRDRLSCRACTGRSSTCIDANHQSCYALFGDSATTVAFHACKASFLEQVDPEFHNRNSTALLLDDQ